MSIIIECRWCKKEFLPWKHGIKYCCEKCRIEGAKKFAREYTRKRRKKDKQKDAKNRRKRSQKRYYNKKIRPKTKKYKLYLAELRKKDRLKRKDKVEAKRKIDVQKAQDWFWEYKKTLKCEKCGMDHPAALDFHHKDPSKKEFLIGRGVRQRFSKERVMKEIEKCTVLCRNCHSILHYEEKNDKFVTIVNTTLDDKVQVTGGIQR